jgi:hypothetical protein
MSNVTDALNDRLEALEKAIEAAGFKVEDDARGRLTLWCRECRRDSGFHWSICSKSKPNRIQE